jgi:hypothetical protein
MQAKTITLAAEVTKSHAQLVLPMSTVMHDMLTARKPERATGYVFANRSKLGHVNNDSSTALWTAISETAGTPINRHDLRRTFEDIATECKIDSDVRRLLINHVSGADVHSRHYANNRRNLASAADTIANWIVAQARIAEAQASGANVLAFGKQA